MFCLASPFRRNAEKGFDAPNCDGVLFAAPRSSITDITQMAGRAMTVSPGKKRGVVIVPAAIEREEDFYASDKFAAIRMVVTGLASSDGRVLHSLQTPAGLPGGPHLDIRASERLAQTVDVNALAADIRLKVWRRLGRLHFLSHDEAREWVIANAVPLGIAHQSRWKKWVQQPNCILPPNIPAAPQSVYYTSGWKGWDDWFGRDVWHRKGQKKSFQEAKTWVQANLVPFGITHSGHWAKYVAGKGFLDAPTLDNIPVSPSTSYREWESWDDWFGIEELWSFQEAKAWVQANLVPEGINSLGKLKKWRESNALPRFIPISPQKHYSKEWQGWTDWFGKSKPLEHVFWPYEEAKAWVQAQWVPLGINSSKKWQQALAGKIQVPPRPSNIPFSPQTVYRTSGWEGWGDWFGR